MHLEYVITGFTLVSGGSNYTTPAVVITGAGGSGATATARVSQGTIIDVVLTNAGLGYTSAPTISFRDPNPRASGASATVNVDTIEVQDPPFNWTPVLIGSGLAVVAAAVYRFGIKKKR